MAKRELAGLCVIKNEADKEKKKKDNNKMDIKTVKVGPEKANCYIVSDNSGNAFVVDPGNDFEAINLELKKIK